MSIQNDPCLHELPTSEVIGLSFTALAGFVSCLAVLFVLTLVARNYIRNVRNPPPGGEWRLIRTHVDAYLLSLLASDMLQGLGAVLNVQWAAERRSYCSASCTAQGFIQQIGETGVAMGTFAIALQTFLVIFFRWSPSKRSSWIWKSVIAFIWLYVCIFAAVGYGLHHTPADNAAELDSFFTPTPYWCWISGHFNAERIAGEYFWLWFAAFSSIALYLLLFFRVRGNIEVDPQNWRRIRFKLRRWTDEDGMGSGGDGFFAGSGRGARGGEAGRTAAKEAMSMIWYPVTYTLLVLPLSIVRWSTFRPPGRQEPHVPFAVTSVVIFIFSSSGLVNVVLMLLTRKNLLLFGQRGVVNPARIGPAAQARLNAMQARMNRQNNRPRDNNNDGDDGEADVGMRRIGANLGDGDALAAAGAGRGEVGDGTKMRRISEEQMEGPGGMISEKNAQKRGSLSGRIRAVVGLSALTGHYSPDGNSQRRPSSAKSKEREESTDDTTSGEQQQQQQHHAHRFGFGFGHRNTTNVTVDNNNQKKRNEEEIGGDTSFVAGGFTTGAFETERSFELGSAHLPSTIHSPTSPTSPYPFYSPHTASYPPPPRSAALAPPSPLPTAAATARGDENSRRELDVVASTGGRETYDSTLYADLPSSSRALHDDYDADLGRRRPREGHGVDEDDGRKLPYHASQDYDGIPEGMSRHLGSAGEYDTDPLAPPLPPPAGLTDLQLAAYQRSGPTTTGEHQRRDMVVDRLQIPDPSSQPEFEYSHASTLRSNFLDLDPSRSNVGAGSSAGVVVPDAEHGHAATTAAAPVATTAPRAISPSSPMHPPAAHLPREHPHYPHSHPAAGSPVAYSIATGEGGVVVVGNPISEGRRGSAVSKVSQSGSVRSRGSAPKSSVDIYDYSVPMKFNPTPPAPPPAPLADSGEVEISRTHSRSPFGSRSRNTSNKSLNKSSSKTSLRKSGSKSAIAADVDPLAPPYHYQRRGSEGTMTTTNEMSLYGSSASPATVSSSKAAPWTSLTTLFSSKGGEGGGRPKRETLEPQPVLDIAPRKSTDRSTKGGRTSSSYGPSPPNSAQSDSRLLSKRSADLAQHRGMVYSQSQSHQHHHQQQQQQQQNWSRASGSSAGGGSASLLAAGRRPSATQTDEEVQMAYRPNTGGSTRSYRSYTFGPPGIASSSSTPSPTPAAAPHHTGEGAAAVHPLTYDEPSLQMRSKGFSDQEIGRAL